jgi:hypothetical protein
MKVEQNEFGQITISCPQIFYNGEWFIDWRSFVELSGLPSTNLHRIIKQLPNVDENIFIYRNRKLYKTVWAYQFSLRQMKS